MSLGTPAAPAQFPVPDGTASGVLHVFVAFDWGDEIDLAAAARLSPAKEYPLSRRRRTPSSISYRPAPLRITLPASELPVAVPGGGPVTTEITLFDFGGVSVEFEVPFQASPAELLQFADSLAASDPLVDAAHRAAQRLFETLRPAIKAARWSELSEEYMVFRLLPGQLAAPAELRSRFPAWLAGLARLESTCVTEEEIAESLRLASSYSPHDLFVPEWAAAVLIDDDCEETLQVIELANLQLLEFRYLDNRLDSELARAYSLIQPLARSWLPFWRTHMRPLRAFGEMKVETHALFERATNVLKLAGDQYIARLYRRLTTRFHHEEWAASIHESLSIVESVYEVVSDQAATYRTELLEITVVALIVIEIVLAFWH